MASYSKLIIVGYVGRDPELHMTPNGKAVCDFSVAINRYAKAGAEPVTDWYRVSLWGDAAERGQQWITKGRLVLIEGQLTPRLYQDRQGETKLSLDVFAHNWQLLDKKPALDSGSVPRDMETDPAQGVGPDF